ncbi:MAG: hypothetical protein ACI959_000306 [Limisphaerales bacterium]|jgi:hypothetical protein
MKRRLVYLLFLIIVLFSGLASRAKVAEQWPEFISTYSGDTLWALLVYYLFAILFFGHSAKRIFIYAIVFAFAIEISQLYQADWLNKIRHSTFGSLVLGRGFLWTDFLCYFTGIIFGFIVDRILRKRLL